MNNNSSKTKTMTECNNCSCGCENGGCNCEESGCQCGCTRARIR